MYVCRPNQYFVLVTKGSIVTKKRNVCISINYANVSKLPHIII